jgi:hypothetical protein
MPPETWAPNAKIRGSLADQPFSRHVLHGSGSCTGGGALAVLGADTALDAAPVAVGSDGLVPIAGGTLGGGAASMAWQAMATIAAPTTTS